MVRELMIAVPIAIIVIALVLIRTLWLPGLGCWLLYLFSLVISMAVVALGLLTFGVGSLLKHLLEDQHSKDVQTYVISGVAIMLVFGGRKLLETYKKQPFPAFMRWFIKHTFHERVGDTLPTGLPTTHSRWRAFKAVFDDAYPEDRFGSGPVEGWGVRACRRRLLAIKHR